MKMICYNKEEWCESYQDIIHKLPHFNSGAQQMQFLSHKKIEKETTVIIRGLFNFISILLIKSITIY